MAKVKQAIIAAAGTGTRWYPYSFFTPKELLPIGGVPVVQHVVEELFTAGVEKIIVVLAKDKEPIKEYFSYRNHELLAKKIKDKSIAQRALLFADNLKKTKIIFCYQDGSRGYGNGVPLLFAKKELSKEPFFYTWADDFIASNPTRFEQLAETYKKHKVTVLSGVRAKTEDDYINYAYIKASKLPSGEYSLDKIYEKPGPVNTPSDMGVLSGHLFAAEVVDYAEKAHKNCKNEEFTFNDIMHAMVDENLKILVKEIDKAVYFDTGNPTSYAESINNFMLYSNREV